MLTSIETFNYTLPTTALAHAHTVAKKHQESYKQQSPEFSALTKFMKTLLTEIKSRRQPPKGSLLEQSLSKD